MFPIKFFQRSVDRAPDRVAVRIGERSITYRQLAREVDALSHAMQVLAGKERVTVALLCPNSLDLLRSILAIHRCGGVLVPLNPRNSALELASQVELVTPDLIVVDSTCLGMVDTAGIAVIVAGLREHSVHPTVENLLHRFEGAAPNWPSVDVTEDYAVKFTGGSSGRPKGVRQSFRSHVAVVMHVLGGLKFSDGEVYVCAAPLTHGAGSFVLPTLAVGGCIVVPHSSKPDVLLDIMERCEATATWVPPTLLYLLIDSQKARPRKLNRLKHLIYGGAPVTPARIDEALEVFGAVLESTYGQTEASTIVTALCASDLVDPRTRYSAGRCCALVDVRIADPDGRIVPVGELGEILVAGDLLMSGYLGMPEESSRTVVNKWLHTGDVGCLDARGYLYIKDRIRDVVISGGFNVYPTDVEAALDCHPAVRESVVFGVADAHWGERVEAAVELHPGVVATENDLLVHARELLGAVKTPKRIHVVETLPRSPVGKVLRRQARLWFADIQH